MNILDYLEEGKINKEGIRKIQDLIDWNEKLEIRNKELEKAFGYKEEVAPYTMSFKKIYNLREDVMDDFTKDKIDEQVKEKTLEYKKHFDEMITLKLKIKKSTQIIFVLEEIRVNSFN